MNADGAGVTAPAARRWTGARRGGVGNRIFAALAASSIGRAIAPVLLVFVVAYFFAVAPAARAASFDLARRVGRGDTAFARLGFAFRHLFTFGSILFDRMVIASAGYRRLRIETEGEDELRSAVAAGRGVVLVTAHVGNWAAMAHGLAVLDVPITVVMHGAEAGPRSADADLARVRIVPTDGGPAAAAASLGALARGEVVAVMGDRLFGGRGVELPFLGGRAEFPLGPYALALTSGAPVFFAFAIRGPRARYRFVGIELGTLGPIHDRRQRDAELGRAAAKFASRLEELVRAHPEQWGNLYPFWSDGAPVDGEERR